MTSLLEIEHLTKRFGPIVAVNDVSFSVDRGEVLGLLGPNGAGKSTTMKMATGYLSPTSGNISICGHDVRVQPIEVKRRIGYLPEGAPLYGDMTPNSLLDFVCAVRKLSREQRRRGLDHVIESLHLQRVLYQPIETLSKGYKRRVGLAQAIVHDPDVLFLDEPTDGLDPNQKHEVRELLEHMASSKAIIISTHILEEVDAICSRAIIISQGRIVADQIPAHLEERSRFHNAVGIRIAAAGAERCVSVLNEISAVQSVHRGVQANGMSELVVFPANGESIIDPVRAAIDQSGIQVSELFVERGRLEDVFRELTTETAAAATSTEAVSQGASGTEEEADHV